VESNSWWGPAAFVTLWLVGVFVILGLFSVTDRILKRLHDRHPDAWAEFGRPRGMFWRPPDETATARTYEHRVVSRAIAAASRSKNAHLVQDSELRALLTQRRRLQWCGWVNLAVLFCVTVGPYLLHRR